jgi:hypothetical protein
MAQVIGGRQGASDERLPDAGLHRGGACAPLRRG